MMFGKRRKSIAGSDPVPAPVKLPPVEGLQEEEARPRGCGSRLWLWALLVAVVTALLVIFVVILGVMGVYDGLRDRAIANRQLAQEHYDLGLEHLQGGNYELAVAEFELAMRYDSSLRDLKERLLEAKDLARAQVTPTSGARRDAATLLYQQAVPYYESGDLAQAVAALEELRGLDAGYQRENVETMLVTAHYQLGLNAVQQDRLDEATEHFDAVLALKPGDEEAQDQLNLLNLYRAALNHWEQDWPATIQALKGLYALAPEYKDVRARLHNAHAFHAQEYTTLGDWCRAYEEFAAAVEVFPLEATVDKRDDAALRCQATAEAPTATPTAWVTVPSRSPTAATTGVPQATPTPAPTTPAAPAGRGRIAFTSFDAPRQRYDIYVVDLTEGEAVLLKENASQPAFTADGGRLAFRNHDPSHLGLGILDLRSDWFGEVTGYAEDTAPAWSPDAQRIVFASDKHGDRKWRIYVISPGQVRGEGQEWTFGRMPTWSPDGSQVAYHGCDERGDNCGVWVMNAGGFSPGRLTTDPGDTAPSWSPDGSTVAFISARNGNWELYRVDVASGEEVRLTDHPASDVAPTWSPGGERLAFLSNRDGSWAVYVLEVQSGQVQKVVAAGDSYPNPVSARLSWVP